MLTKSRRRLFFDPAVIECCEVEIRRAARKEFFEILVACYMPDHLHLVVEGRTTGADLREFMRLAKQLSGFYVKKRFAVELWAGGYHDRIVRGDEDVRRYVRYVCENPVRARLVERADDYPFLFLATSWRDL